MTSRTRTTEEQQLLNARMRRDDVREYALQKAMHAQPAAPDEVKTFLRTAPPEVLILLDGLTVRADEPSEVDRERNDRIVAGVVGWLRKGASW